MITPQDKELLAKKGISEAQIASVMPFLASNSLSCVVIILSILIN